MATLEELDPLDGGVTWDELDPLPELDTLDDPDDDPWLGGWTTWGAEASTEPPEEELLDDALVVFSNGIEIESNRPCWHAIKDKDIVANKDSLIEFVIDPPYSINYLPKMGHEKSENFYQIYVSLFK